MIVLLFEMLLLIIGAMAAYHCYTRYGRAGRLLEKIPGPPGLPFFGNVFQFLVSKPEQLIPYAKKVNRQYYPAYRLWGVNLSGVIVLNPDDAEVVLTSTKHIEKSAIYKFIRPWLADGLLLSTGVKWQNRRKILTPAFHFNVLQKYLSILLEHGEKLANSLKTDMKAKDIELIPLLTYHTLSAICETAMGTSLQGIDPEEVEKYREAVFYMGELTVYRLLRPWLLMDFFFENFTPSGWKQRRAVKTLHAFSRKIIKERTEYHRNSDWKLLKELSDQNNDDDIGIIKGKGKRMSMLDLLIAASMEGLIDEQGIAEEVDTFIFEGHDTSAMGLVFLIQILAEYEDVQEKARAEVNEMWESCGGKINMNTLNKIPYLERCIKESLRLYPSVTFISRILQENLQLKSYLVPAGTMVHVYIAEIHRDPNYWPDPHKFDPDRFLPEKLVNRHPFSYIPFSAGPRNCIGQKFANMELKIFAIYILRHFKLKTALKHEDIVQYPDLVFRPVEKMNVTFIPIKT